MFFSIKGFGQLTADFYASSTDICNGATVTFTDNSTGISDYTEYSWDFGEGASPDVAMGIGPHLVRYSGSGTSTIRLTITNGITESDAKTISITVNALPAKPVESVNCSLGFEEATINIVSPLGEDLEYRLDGGKYQSGTSFRRVRNGSHTITVRNSAGCITTGDYFEVSCGCHDGATVTLGGSTGTTCTISPITVTGNTFGGGASWVLITEDGEGSVSPSISYSSPFSFTYTPKNKDAGKIVRITVTTNNPSGSHCVEAKETYLLNINSNPSAPEIGIVIQPSCTISAGSVVLDKLPAGDWTINPGGIKGSNTSITIPGLAPGTYNFTVTNSAGCLSSPSGNITIHAQPLPPSDIIQSIDCSQGFGKAIVSVSSPVGPGLEYSMDGGIYRGDNSFTGVNNGNHFISARNSSGCITRGAGFLVSCGCSNPPIVNLSSQGGNTCGTSTVTVRNNIFRGNVKTVNLTSDGAGIISPASASASPFTFTYTPSESDSGKKIIISVTTDNPSGEPCKAATATYTLAVNTKPDIPSVGIITQLSCAESTGSVILNGLPSSGTWILNRNPGSVKISGSGPSIKVAGLIAGSYTFSVTNEEGCTSNASAGVVINSNPGNPLAPVIGTITVPTCNLPTGSVLLNGLPGTDSWTLTRYPDIVNLKGSGSSTNISGLSEGTYNFTVASANGCVSPLSKNIIIPARPGAAKVIITNPDPVCSPRKVDLTSYKVTAGSSPDMVFTYYTDASATTEYLTPSVAGDGTYYIKGTNNAGCNDIKPVTVKIYALTKANAGPDKILYNQYSTSMEADLNLEDDTGVWSVISGTGDFLNDRYAKTTVSNLSINENIFVWKVTNGICPESYDTVIISVNDIQNKILITPNMDGRNDYFVFKGLKPIGKTELIVFDRRGVLVYKNGNYDNLWNGIDYRGNQLQDDTYFYILKTESGWSVKGFIVIRR